MSAAAVPVSYAPTTPRSRLADQPTSRCVRPWRGRVDKAGESRVRLAARSRPEANRWLLVLKACHGHAIHLGRPYLTERQLFLLPCWPCRGNPSRQTVWRGRKLLEAAKVARWDAGKRRLYLLNLPLIYSGPGDEGRWVQAQARKRDQDAARQRAAQARKRAARSRTPFPVGNSRPAKPLKIGGSPADHASIIAAALQAAAPQLASGGARRSAPAGGSDGASATGPVECESNNGFDLNAGPPAHPAAPAPPPVPAPPPRPPAEDPTRDPPPATTWPENPRAPFSPDQQREIDRLCGEIAAMPGPAEASAELANAGKPVVQDEQGKAGETDQNKGAPGEAPAHRWSTPGTGRALERLRAKMVAAAAGTPPQEPAAREAPPAAAQAAADAAENRFARAAADLMRQAAPVDADEEPPMPPPARSAAPGREADTTPDRRRVRSGCAAVDWSEAATGAGCGSEARKHWETRSNFRRVVTEQDVAAVRTAVPRLAHLSSWALARMNVDAQELEQAAAIFANTPPGRIDGTPEQFLSGIIRNIRYRGATHAPHQGERNGTPGR